ncbi:hypothetical protein [Saccharothrix sp. ALI-22-I]|uniref:hypothetical protein n=1 Tax=Saccharothrix sp. ALI-22-I TaxID=1933778 RepID=UPI001930E968|nr:hypothetical protein [Saccharothrix sp. ALI-22-I]
MGFSRDQDVVEEFASDGADESFAVGVHARGLQRAGDHTEVVGLKDGVECLAVLAVAVAEQEAQRLHPGVEVGGEVSGLLGCPGLGRVGGDVGDVQAPGAVFEERQCVEAFSENGVDVEKSVAMMLVDWAVRNSRQVGPARRGAGSMPAACRICRTVEGAIRWPSRAGSPCNPPMTPPRVLPGKP